MRKMVSIKKDGVVAECMPEAVPVWEADGWTLVEDGSSGGDESDQPLTPTEWSNVDQTDQKE